MNGKSCSEAMRLPSGHKARNYQSWNLNPRSLTLELIYINILLCSLCISEGCLCVCDVGPAKVWMYIKIDIWYSFSQSTSRYL